MTLRNTKSVVPGASVTWCAGIVSIRKFAGLSTSPFSDATMSMSIVPNAVSVPRLAISSGRSIGTGVPATMNCGSCGSRKCAARSTNGASTVITASVIATLLSRSVSAMFGPAFTTAANW